MKISIKSDKSLRYMKLAAVIMVCLVLTTSLVYGWMKKDIVISDAGKEIAISTFKNTVKDVLNEKAINIGPFDKMSISMTEKLEDGLSISIQRAKKVNIKTKDSSIFIYTNTDTVENALKEAEILIGSKDRVEPTMSSMLQDEMQVNVIRVEEKLTSQNVPMEFTNEVKKIESLAKGLVNVVKKGQSGEKEVTIKTVYEDGKEVSKQIVSETVIKEPVNGLIEEGVKTTLITSRGQVNFTRAIKMSATAYDATFESCGKHPDDPQYGITYSGLKVRPGIVAVDPRVIPLGTWLYVEGYGEALAA
ncbi:MAG TPA: G5 domain-containing protein, partial [Patescibacteria group bacterium]|nr:G5 domain-containing protein [Patescibacteria group bacterium]